MADPIPPPDSCPITWQPHALAPVFHGRRDYGPRQGGAPVPLRVFFPSIDVSPPTAAALAGCGRYPAILFAHGSCPGDANHYQRWVQLPAQLARAGYVVVVPQIPDISTTPRPTHPALDAMADILQWLRHRWEHRQVLMPADATGIAGHSFGGVLTALFALTHDVAAYAAVGGDWHGSGLFPIIDIRQPKLVIWGVDEPFSQLTEQQWDKLSAPKHRAVFENGEHWDYLPSGQSPCHAERGTCPHIPAATTDLLTMFFGRYLPPELFPDLPSRIPKNLVPPRLVLSPEQKPFANDYLLGMRALDTHAECGVTLTEETPTPYDGSASFAIGLENI
jgi:acetyl esterase/lipase